MKKLLVSLVLSLACVAVACSDDDKSSSTSSSSSSGTSGTSGSSGGADAGGDAKTGGKVVEVNVTSNEFVPPSVTINVGDTVQWVWGGGNHDVVSGANCTDDNMFTPSPLQSDFGASFEHTYDKAGTFEYFCTPHCLSAGMKGTVIVNP